MFMLLIVFHSSTSNTLAVPICGASTWKKLNERLIVAGERPHEHTHARTRAHTHARTRTRTHACTHARVGGCGCGCGCGIVVCMHPLAQTKRCMCVRACASPCMRVFVCACARLCVHVRGFGARLVIHSYLQFGGLKLASTFWRLILEA